jgi:hypothetical protein
VQNATRKRKKDGFSDTREIPVQIVVQKSNAETAVLKATRAKGLMLSGITLLATEKLIP